MKAPISTRFSGVLITALLSFVVFSGCAQRRCAKPSPLQDNIYAAGSRLPAALRRVALLPFTAETSNWEAHDGAGELEPVLLRELGKLNRFETVLISPQQLKLWTGKESWIATEALPSVLVDRLQKDFGCDGALFTHLQSYHPYKPLVLGWNLKLLDLQGQKFIWAADEVFDAGDKFVAHEAHRYHSHRTDGGCRCRPSDLVLLSPKEFGGFSLSMLLATLPPR